MALLKKIVHPSRAFSTYLKVGLVQVGESSVLVELRHFVDEDARRSGAAELAPGVDVRHGTDERAKALADEIKALVYEYLHGFDDLADAEDALADPITAVVIQESPTLEATPQGEENLEEEK